MYQSERNDKLELKKENLILFPMPTSGHGLHSRGNDYIYLYKKNQQNEQGN
jgi:hypothetical protein